MPAFEAAPDQASLKTSADAAQIGSSSPSRYAAARLRLGMAGVGSITLAAGAALILNLPTRLFPHEIAHPAWEVFSLGLFVFGWVLLMTPFDLLGGYLLPVRDGRCAPGARSWATRWGKAVLLQAAFLLVSLLTVLWSGRLGGTGLAVLAAAGLMGIQFVFMSAWFAWRARSQQQRFQSAINSVAAALRRWNLRGDRLRFLSHHDVGFTGGVVGFPGRERVLLPSMWNSALSAEELAAVAARRIVATERGYQSAGLLAALVWNAGGFWLSCLAAGGALHTVADVVSTSLGMTLWSFLGLLTLPTLSRRAAFAVDRSAVRWGVPVRPLKEALRKLDRMQDDEPERAPLVETIFHPVPCLRARLDQLDEQRDQDQNVRHPRGIWWNVARTAIPLSTACTGLLSRAVHCNVGRPELWWLLPLD